MNVNETNDFEVEALVDAWLDEISGGPAMKTPGVYVQEVPSGARNAATRQTCLNNLKNIG